VLSVLIVVFVTTVESLVAFIMKNDNDHNKENEITSLIIASKTPFVVIQCANTVLAILYSWLVKESCMAVSSMSKIGEMS
jgi:hypothetical protein